MKKKFKDRIKELRLEKNWSQETLAKRLNVSQQTIAAWERGIKPKIDKIEESADIFRVSVDYLLGRSDKRGIPYTIDEIKELHPELSDSMDKLKETMGLEYIMYAHDMTEEQFWKWVANTAKKLSK